MEIHLTVDTQTRLNRLAAERGSDAELLAREAIERFVYYDDWFKAQVQTGIDQIARGEFLEEAEMDARVERMLKS